jgi:lambda repressor-like predicted transcriptional regulator
MRLDHLPFAPLEAVLYRNGQTLKRLEKEMFVVACRARPAGLTLTKAEDVAHWLGLHPSEIWGDEYRAAQPDLEHEPNGLCFGRPSWWRATGRADWYGDPGPFCVAVRAS